MCNLVAGVVAGVVAVVVAADAGPPPQDACHTYDRSRHVRVDLPRNVETPPRSIRQTFPEWLLSDPGVGLLQQ
jgi:hypothetical protein